MKIVLIILIFSLFTDSTSNKLEIIIQKGIKENYKNLELQNRIIPIAFQFLDTPYKGGTLDINEHEECIINTKGLDCVTFFENVIAIAKYFNSKYKDTINQSELYNLVENTRYRNGKIKGYISRLHYTSEWIIDNEKRGNIKNISKELGGIVFNQNVYFMSKHYKKYKKLKSNPELIPKIKEIEKNINKEGIYYIKKENVNKISKKIKSGDIIAITTNIKGLDYSHTGIAYRDEKGKLRLLHASTKYKKVVIDEELSIYLSKNKTQTGISVLRLL